jgi:hypothetical protein
LYLCLNKKEKKLGKNMRRAAEGTLGANGRADKNDHFHVREATQMDARG